MALDRQLAPSSTDSPRSKCSAQFPRPSLPHSTHQCVVLQQLAVAPHYIFKDTSRPTEPQPMSHASVAAATAASEKMIAAAMTGVGEGWYKNTLGNESHVVQGTNGKENWEG